MQLSFAAFKPPRVARQHGVMPSSVRITPTRQPPADSHSSGLLAITFGYSDHTFYKRSPFNESFIAHTYSHPDYPYRGECTARQSGLHHQPQYSANQLLLLAARYNCEGLFHAPHV